jgi:hypothetical protein
MVQATLSGVAAGTGQHEAACVTTYSEKAPCVRHRCRQAERPASENCASRAAHSDERDSVARRELHALARGHHLACALCAEREAACASGT